MNKQIKVATLQQFPGKYGISLTNGARILGFSPRQTGATTLDILLEVPTEETGSQDIDIYLVRQDDEVPGSVDYVDSILTRMEEWHLFVAVK